MITYRSMSLSSNSKTCWLTPSKQKWSITLKYQVESNYCRKQNDKIHKIRYLSIYTEPLIAFKHFIFQSITMRSVFILLFIVITIQSTIAIDCVCECCVGSPCTPVLISRQFLQFCSEATNCRQDDCANQHTSDCPPKGAIGQTRATCQASPTTSQPYSTASSGHFLPTVVMIIGMNILLQLLKDKFWNSSIFFSLIFELKNKLMIFIG